MTGCRHWNLLLQAAIFTFKLYRIFKVYKSAQIVWN
jgi:hypothetical protein